MELERHLELSIFYQELLDGVPEPLLEQFFVDRLAFHCGQLAVHSDEPPKQLDSRET